MFDFSRKNNILALAPHTDDIELGCGATLSRFKESGANIFVVNFSLAPSDPPERTTEEFKKSMSVLDIEYEMLGMAIRHLPELRQEILDYLFKLNKRRDFDIIFCPSSYDNHQDHKTIQDETFRVFKNKTILGYEMPWNCRNFSTDFFVSLEERHLQQKFKMLNFYKSQSHKAFVSKNYVYDIARIRGLYIQKKYAECFEMIRGVA